MPQTQLATQGRLGIMRQTAYDNPQANDALFHYFAFTSCDYGPIDAAAALPTEAGGAPLPRGMYKTGVVFAGNVELIPRLENRFGWILEAAFGDASTFPDMTIAQHIAGAGATPTVNCHQFGFQGIFLGGNYNDFEIPYLTVHKFLPNRTAIEQWGEISQDACISNLVLTVGAAGIMQATVGLLGRGKGTTLWDNQPAWAIPTYDADNTFVETACTGGVQISILNGVPAALTPLDVTAATITLANQLLPPNRSRVVGSPYHLDHPNLARSLTVDIPILVTDYDLYVQAFGGPASPVTDTGWSCTQLEGNIDITVQAGTHILATTEHQIFRFRTTQNNVRWSVRPLVLVPGEPVVLALRGTIVHDATAPFEAFIQNGQPNYT